MFNEKIGPDDDDDNVVDKEEEDDEEESLNSLLPSPPTRSAINSTSAGANEQSCSSDDRGGCEHVCTQSAEPDAIRCLCYRGFRLDSDGKSCAGTYGAATSFSNILFHIYIYTYCILPC